MSGDFYGVSVGRIKHVGDSQGESLGGGPRNHTSMADTEASAEARGMGGMREEQGIR